MTGKPFFIPEYLVNDQRQSKLPTGGMVDVK
jgi:hypothetical protein